MSYMVFVRDGLDPDPTARKMTLWHRDTEAEARAMCAEYNEGRKTGSLSSEAEYMKQLTGFEQELQDWKAEKAEEGWGWGHASLLGEMKSDLETIAQAADKYTALTEEYQCAMVILARKQIAQTVQLAGYLCFLCVAAVGALAWLVGVPVYQMVKSLIW